jgi:hypothetical protein
MDDTLIATDTSNNPETFVHMDSALGKAIQLWSKDRPVPLTIAVELMELGYDVATLERVHRPSFKRI